MIASPHGGVNIEEVAQTTPSEVYKQAVDIETGVCTTTGPCVSASQKICGSLSPNY